MRAAEEVDGHLVAQIKGQRADGARAGGGEVFRARDGRAGKRKHTKLVPNRNKSLLGSGGFFLFS